ncbi:phosphoserine phosphatase [Streptococcus agalactiae LMG 14747]|uniref:phosphoserine phosphatase n=1 Tax=Streptococcus agalactiae LMG 14747 TaxID=1154860 RepID=V6Z2J8_STRAG|nr:phosphoserine phosphatase [Streptococcus agalactiae LMG 14747]
MKKVKGLLVMDVDSTLIMEEGIDLLGEEAGLGQRVADITERAMRGELDFEEALRERVGLLAGLPETVLDRILGRIHFTPGAEELVAELHKRGYKVAVVSGGFHQTVNVLAERLNLDYVKANTLEIVNGVLTGRVTDDIVTKDVKETMLRTWAAENGLDMQDTIAVGDGANDVPMLQAAGIGIAFCAKPIVQKQAPYQINEKNLYQVIEILDRVKN